jgi:hypothetical protein
VRALRGLEAASRAVVVAQDGDLGATPAEAVAASRRICASGRGARSRLRVLDRDDHALDVAGAQLW